MIFDISPPISETLAVFPGDTPFARRVLMDMRTGSNITLSAIQTTVHLGAHVDGANHYGRDAAGVDAWPLEVFVGPCHVVSVRSDSGARFGARELSASPRAERVLLRTRSYPDPAQWTDHFIAPDPALIDHLADRGVRLIGVDTPSVDLASSKDLPSHARCLARGVAILEGLVLGSVEDGVYELIALPLRMIGADASPVRAVLRPLR